MHNDALMFLDRLSLTVVVPLIMTVILFWIRQSTKAEQNHLVYITMWSRYSRFRQLVCVSVWNMHKYLSSKYPCMWRSNWWRVIIIGVRLCACAHVHFPGYHMTYTTWYVRWNYTNPLMWFRIHKNKWMVKGYFIHRSAIPQTPHNINTDNELYQLTHPSPPLSSLGQKVSSSDSIPQKKPIRGPVRKNFWFSIQAPQISLYPWNAQVSKTNPWRDQHINHSAQRIHCQRPCARHHNTHLEVVLSYAPRDQGLPGCPRGT